MEEKFENTRTAEEFKNENYNIENTVYNNMKEGTFIRKNERTMNLMSCKITLELLQKEFSKDNPQLSNTKLMLLPRIADDFDIIKLAKELLDDNDYYMLFLNLIVNFDNKIDTNIMDYLYEISESVKKSSVYVIRAILQLLENDEANACLLLDWYYKTDKKLFANIIGNFLHGKVKDNVLTYLSKYENVFELDDCVLIQSMCLSYELDDVKKYLVTVKSESLPYDKFMMHAMRNKTDDVFVYFSEFGKYECKNINEVFMCVVNKKHKTADLLWASFAGELDCEKIVELCNNSNNFDVVKFVVDNMSTKIDLHHKNDSLLKNLVVNENLEAVKYVVEHMNDKVPTDDDFRKKIKKILRFIDNEELINYVNAKLL